MAWVSDDGESSSSRRIATSTRPGRLPLSTVSFGFGIRCRTFGITSRTGSGKMVGASGLGRESDRSGNTVLAMASRAVSDRRPKAASTVAGMDA